VTALRKRMIEDLRIRNYSPRTIRRYVEVVAQISGHFNKAPDRLSPEDVRSYLVFQVERKVSVSLLKQIVCAIRFLFRRTLGRDFPTHLIPFPREERRIPVILSMDEVNAVVQSTTNLKHRTLFAIAYGTGARLAELCRLKISDIDRQRMVIVIRQGKGHRDREVPLSPQLLDLLETYWRKYRPRAWLFPARSGDHHINRSTFQQACVVARKAAGLTKLATPHSFRHAFATHLLDSNVNIRVVQELLGHKSLRTTMRYTRVTAEGIEAARRAIASLPAFVNLAR